VKKTLKSVKNWQNYGHESVAPFFGPPCSSSLMLIQRFKTWIRQFGQISPCWSSARLLHGRSAADVSPAYATPPSLVPYTNRHIGHRRRYTKRLRINTVTRFVDRQWTRSMCNDKQIYRFAQSLSPYLAYHHVHKAGCKASSIDYLLAWHIPIFQRLFTAHELTEHQPS